MTNTPLNPDEESRLEKALEQSANGQVVSRGSFAQYTQTPLNPDALEDAADVIWMRSNVENGVCRADRERGSYRIAVDATEEAISAYLAVAQPLVTSLEELDAMPDGSVVKDSVGEVYIMTPYDEFWRVWGNHKRFSSCEIVLPARVLDLPEVKP